jgi:hypothetical protein
VRVVDDCGKFHLQNSVEFLDDRVDVELESPWHRVLLPLAIFLISRRYDTIGFCPTGNERTGSTAAAFTTTESGPGAPAKGSPGKERRAIPALRSGSRRKQMVDARRSVI